MYSPSPYKIPIVDLRAQYRKLRPEILQAVDEVLETQQFILGPAVQRFEEQMASYFQCNFALGVASGSDALLLALMALDIGPGDGVLVPPFTFFSTVSSITRLGAKPLFVDIDPESHLLAAGAVQSFIEEHCRLEDGCLIEPRSRLRIRALLPVHLYGRCYGMAELAALAKKYHLPIVEDVAQACGARTVIAGQSRFAGAVGEVGCFSFFPSKNLGGYGDGGLVTTSEKRLGEKLKMLRMHGESTNYYHEVIGINSRLDSVQAAVLSVKLRYLEEWCEQRIQRAETYFRLFRESGLVGDKILSVPATSTDKSHVFNNYVIRVQRRDELKQFLGGQGIQTEIYYPLPLHLQACFASLGYGKGDFPQAELAAGQVLALPIYPELKSSQQESVVGEINKFYRR